MLSQEEDNIEALHRLIESFATSGTKQHRYEIAIYCYLFFPWLPLDVVETSSLIDTLQLNSQNILVLVEHLFSLPTLNGKQEQVQSIMVDKRKSLTISLGMIWYS